MKSLLIRLVRIQVALLLAVICAAGTLAAERPRAFDLLPDSTLALIRVADAPDLINRFMNTSGGKMSQDPQLKPLFEHLYGKAIEAFALIENEVGLPLPKILALPKGELCVGLIGPDIGKPVVVAWLDAGDQIDSAQKLLARATELLDGQGLKKTEETIEGTKILIYDLPDKDLGKLVFFEKDKTVVGFIGNNKQVIEHFLARWDGRPIKVEPPAEDEPADTKKVVTGVAPLTKNERYTAIMSRCRGEKNDTPQITWFVDPIGIFKSFARELRHDGRGRVFAAARPGRIVRRGRKHVLRYRGVRIHPPRPYPAGKSAGGRHRGHRAQVGRPDAAAVGAGGCDELHLDALGCAADVRPGRQADRQLSRQGLYRN